jgi:hypothetical protein
MRFALLKADGRGTIAISAHVSAQRRSPAAAIGRVASRQSIFSKLPLDTRMLIFGTEDIE